MITNFDIENETTQEKISFGQDSTFDYIYEDGGIDWGSVPATHNTYNYPNQVGVSISTTKLNERDVTIEGYVYYVLTKEERESIGRDNWVDYGYSIIKSKKKVLNDIVNPMDYLRILIGGYYLEGKATNSVQYGAEQSTNNEYFCKFLISIYCNDPMFKKETITKTVISGETPVFHFPLIFEPSGVIMSTRVNYLMLAVYNEGNVAIGGKIIFTAKGEVKNPSVENVVTGEKIIIKKTLQPGEVVTVNTTKGRNRGVYGKYLGYEESYLQYWSFDNTWMEFSKGTSLIGYSTENNAEAYLDVTIEINPEKLGLEDM